jgi:hypothetical protein
MLLLLMPKRAMIKRASSIKLSIHSFIMTITMMRLHKLRLLKCIYVNFSIPL